MGVEPSVAYVQGFRVENLATKYVAVDKPRDHVNENQQSISMQLGNFVKATTSSIRGIPDLGGTNGAYATVALSLIHI